MLIPQGQAEERLAGSVLGLSAAWEGTEEGSGLVFAGSGLEFFLPL